MDEDHELKQSKFNTGVAIAMRLNDLWNRCNIAYRSGNFPQWNSILDTIYLELSDDVDEDDMKEYTRLNYIIIKTKLNPYWLMKKHIWIKHVQKKQGIGKKYLEESEYDFD